MAVLSKNGVRLVSFLIEIDFNLQETYVYESTKYTKAIYRDLRVPYTRMMKVYDNIILTAHN